MSRRKPRLSWSSVQFGKRVYRGWKCVGDGCAGFASTPYGAWRNWLMEMRQAFK